MTDNDKVPELTNGEFDDFIKQGYSIIDFFACWCMPCLMMSPIFEELSEKFKGKVKFGKVNVEDNPKIAQKHDINSIPHFILFKDKEIVDEFVGAISGDDIEDKLNQELKMKIGD